MSRGWSWARREIINEMKMRGSGNGKAYESIQQIIVTRTRRESRKAFLQLGTVAMQEQKLPETRCFIDSNKLIRRRKVEELTHCINTQ